MNEKPTADIVVEMESPVATVALLHGATPAGRAAVGGRVVCEPRFVADIVAGATADGLNVNTEAMQ